MSDHRVVRTVLVATALIGLGPLGHCDEPPQSPSPPADRAMELMRREAKKASDDREAAFQRVILLPQVVVRVNAAPRIAVRQRERLDGAGTTLITALIQPRGTDGKLDLASEPRMEVLEASFDLSVFGSTGDAGSAGSHLDFLLRRTLDEIEATRERPLVDVQKKKLLLAGRGDIKRLFDRVEHARKEFNTLTGDVAHCDDFLTSLLPLSRELRRGPFQRSDSLLRKMLRRIDGTEPTEEQAKRSEASPAPGSRDAPR